ncbi:hypothetical protein RV16_GL002355 [Enterococcus saccharolyticus]|nr:hypothetical protein RV16_GL002355 [Enterococcus saccharolyticus]
MNRPRKQKSTKNQRTPYQQMNEMKQEMKQLRTENKELRLQNLCLK